jgi:hypothetical protein
VFSQEAQDNLEQEKGRIRENRSAILERAIINLGRPVTSSSGVVSSRAKHPRLFAMAKGGYYGSEILDRMAVMKHNGNLSYDEIATRFNKAGLKTCSGKGQWHEITIFPMCNL